jgi:hypothetical protein
MPRLMLILALCFLITAAPAPFTLINDNFSLADLSNSIKHSISYNAPLFSTTFNNQYQLSNKTLGVGGNGVLFSAIWKETGENVAVKFGIWHKPLEFCYSIQEVKSLHAAGVAGIDAISLIGCGVEFSRIYYIVYASLHLALIP